MASRIAPVNAQFGPPAVGVPLPLANVRSSLTMSTGSWEMYAKEE